MLGTAADVKIVRAQGDSPKRPTRENELKLPPQRSRSCEPHDLASAMYRPVQTGKPTTEPELAVDAARGGSLVTQPITPRDRVCDCDSLASVPRF